MRNLVLRLFYGLTIVVSTGCVTHYSVTKVTPTNNPKGLRVRLPAPFIVGRPSTDGTVKYTVELLPDPDQEYAINAWTIMAKQKADISRTIEMYVQKMTLAQDTTAVASQLAASAGSVGKSAVDNLIAQQTAHTAAVTQKEADVAAKRTAYEKAEVDVDAAKAALEAAKQSGNATAIQAAQTALATSESALAKAKIEWQAAQTALAKARNFDQPTSPHSQSAAGPVIYRIVEDPTTGGIQLEPIKFKLFAFNGKAVEGRQLRFETAGKKPASDSSQQGAASAVPKPQVSLDTTINRYSGNLSYTVTFDSEVKQLLDGDTTVKDAQGADQKKFLKTEVSGTKGIKLTWDQQTPSSKYAVNLWILFKDNRAAPYPMIVTVQ